MANTDPAPLVRIAVSTWRRTLPTSLLGPQDLVTVGADYVRHIVAAGGLPVVLPASDPTAAGYLLVGADGVLLVGGGDVDPASYGRVGDGRSAGPDPAADAFEIGLARAALARRLPVLAVCRGMQILNVATGGTLLEDVSDRTDRPHAAAPGVVPLVHPVVLEPDSRLRAALPGLVEVNSIHHQALDRVGAGLRVVARAPDGIVEAVEPLDPAIDVIGVQWHPEKAEGNEGLFDWLVRCARKRALAII